MLSIVPSLVILGAAAFTALWLTSNRFTAPTLDTERSDASKVLATATVIQGMHFTEEWTTGFDILFPALFGLDPMPRSFFVVFNLVWLMFWIASVPMLRSARKSAFFAAWFLSIAGILNGIAHPLMSAFSRGYFPGLVTSPLIGLAGVALWRRLISATAIRGGVR